MTEQGRRMCRRQEAHQSRMMRFTSFSASYGPGLLPAQHVLFRAHADGLSGWSLAKKVGVCAGTFEAKHFTVQAINQDPIGFDMKIAAWLTFAFQRVVGKPVTRIRGSQGAIAALSHIAPHGTGECR